MLILLGILTLTGVMRWIQDSLATPKHPHLPGHHYGARLHSNLDPRDHQRLGGLGRYQIVRPLLVGVIPRMAGSATIALLILGTIPNPVWATAYMLLFGSGTIAGMILVTAAIGAPFACTATHMVRFNRYLSVVSGVLSFGAGLFLVYQIGFVDGLVTSCPR